MTPWRSTTQGRRSAIGAFLVVALLVVGSVSACGVLGNPLEGTKWKLTSWTVSSVDLATITITAAFDGGRISGNSGVNTYGGTCSVGPGKAFSVGSLAVTEMAGPEPAMRSETAYLTLLAQAKSYAVAGGQLTLYDAGGNESLVFDSTGK